MECVKVLLPSLIENEEHEKMTRDARQSLISFDNCVKLYEDNKKYEKAVAGVWNAFLDKWRGKDYDFLMITANDVIHDPMMIDYMLQFAKDHPEAGVISCKVTRDKEEFKKHFGTYKYENVETKGLKDPATFMLRKGVIEEVGRIDEYFPREFVERDYLYRCRLAGFEWKQPDIVLSFHPDHAGTIGNNIERLQKALKRYMSKWGGDADHEVWEHPMNDMSLNYQYCIE